MLFKVESQTHLMHLCDMEIKSILYHDDKNKELDKQTIEPVIPFVALLFSCRCILNPVESAGGSPLSREDQGALHFQTRLGSTRSVLLKALH